MSVAEMVRHTLVGIGNRMSVSQCECVTVCVCVCVSLFVCEGVERRRTICGYLILIKRSIA